MKKELESNLRCFKELVNLCKSSTKAVTVFINKRKAAAKKAEKAQQSARVKAEAAAKKEKYAAEKNYLELSGITSKKLYQRDPN